MAMATKKEEDAPKAELQAEPTFLKAVAQMATLAEEAMRKLRTETHRDNFKFTDLDLSHLYPQTVNSIEYLERLEPVVRDYLSQTARFGLDEKGDSLSGTSIEENTVSYEFTVEKWRKEVYTARKDEIDARVKALSKDISDYANLRARDAAFALGTHSDDRNRFMALAEKPELGLDDLLAGTLAELKTRFYESELPHPEDLAKLYELCFNAEVKQRGWMELEDEKVAEALEAEKIPLEMFAKYTGREVKLLEGERAGEKGKIGQILDIITGKKSPAGAGNLSGNARVINAGEYIKLENIVCTDADGKEFEQYDKIYVKKEVEKSPQSEILSLTPYNAIHHCQQQGDFVPSSALMANIMIALFQAAVERQADGTYRTKDVELEEALQKYKNRGDGVGGHWVNTLVNWGAGQVIHYPNDADFTSNGGTVQINNSRSRTALGFNRNGFTNTTLAEALTTPNYRRYLQNYTGLPDPMVLIGLAEYFEKTARSLVSSLQETRAAWLGCDYVVVFDLGANGSLSYSGAVRGVRRSG